MEFFTYNYDNLIIVLWIFLLGLVFGSFLNVCIYRIPLGQSVVFPNSYCPKCQRKIKAWELIPVFSFLFQQGRCTGCSEKISWIYPAIETVTGFLFVYLWYYCEGELIKFAFFAAFGCIFLVISVIDIQHMIIPDRLLVWSVPLILLWLAEKTINNAEPLSVLYEAGGSFLLGTGILGSLYFFSRGGMGFGDVKFASLFSLLLAPWSVLLALTLAGLLGSFWGITGLVLGKYNRKSPIPFGPFLALGVYVSLLYGERLNLFLIW